MTTTSTTWVCPHLDPEALELIQKALVFSAKHANRNPQTRAELDALARLVAAVRERNLGRRTNMRDATRRYRARQKALAERLEATA